MASLTLSVFVPDIFTAALTGGATWDTIVVPPGARSVTISFTNGALPIVPKEGLARYATNQKEFPIFKNMALTLPVTPGDAVEVRTGAADTVHILVA